MGRPKAFEVDEALDRAMAVFWAKGFEAATIQDLVEATGVQRQSLYATFGDKRQLFLKALDRYRLQRGQIRAALLEEDAPVRVLLGRLLRGVLETLESQGRRGCMMVNTASDALQLEAEMVALVETNIQDLKASLAICLRRAQARGELGGHQDPEALACFFVNALYGLNTLGKVVKDRDTLDAIVKVTLAVLG
ncbi:MAG: TetR family transcriptional regulator [Holophagaceae bacterium]|nr:TetR family transcriptional regulator [Holophagaceae bacterium]